MYSWYLQFSTDIDQSPEHAEIVAAFEHGFGFRLPVRWSEWRGNPHDGYGQTARGAVEAPRVGLQDVSVELGHRFSDGGQTPDHRDASLLRASLTGDGVAAMSEIWTRLARALEALGYADITLAGTPAGIVDSLEEAGEVARAAALRVQITDILCDEVASGGEQSLSISFTRPHDMERILRAAPAPERLTSLRLVGCGLTHLPPILTTAPVRFKALEWLNLSSNPLQVLPPLKPLYPSLSHLVLQHCRSIVLKRADWAGVKVVRRSRRPRRI